MERACGLEAKRGECEIETSETEAINGVRGEYREVDEGRQIKEREGRNGEKTNENGRLETKERERESDRTAD